MITTITFGPVPPPGRYSSGSRGTLSAKLAHPAMPSRDAPVAPAPAALKKSLRVNVFFLLTPGRPPHRYPKIRTLPANTSSISIDRTTRKGSRRRLICMLLNRPEPRTLSDCLRNAAPGHLPGSGHVCLEGVGQMIDGREFVRVLPFHVLHELLLRLEEHLGIALFLILQNRVLAAVVVVSWVDEQVVGEGSVGVIERVVLADRVAVGEICAPAGPYKQGVGGENAARQHYGDQILGVSRRVDKLDRKVADPEAVAVLDPHVYAARRGILVHHDLRRCLVF